MPYQLVFAAYLAATTINSLLARRYAAKTTLHPLVSGILTNAVIALPLAILYALATDAFMRPSTTFMLVALVEAAAGSAYGVLVLYAQKHSDASTFATMIKIHVVIVLLLSGLLLGESLTAVQAAGATLLLSSGLLLSKGVHKRGLQYNLACVPLLATVVLLGRLMVKETNVGMYLVTATILGLVIKLVIKGREFKHNLPEIRKELKQRSVLSAVTFMQVMLFLLASDLSGNVSLISSLASVKVITVMIASYIFLDERSRMRRKAIAAALSLAGLLLI